MSMKKKSKIMPKEVREYIKEGWEISSKKLYSTGDIKTIWLRKQKDRGYLMMLICFPPPKKNNKKNKTT